MSYMNYTIYLGNDKISLDSELDLEGRIDLCEQIIEENLQYFQYKLNQNKSEFSIGTLVEKRLDTMATYILAAAKKDEECTYTTPYKEQINKYRETNFSFFDEI